MEPWIFGIGGLIFGVAGVVFGARAEIRATRRDRREMFDEEPPPWSPPLFLSGSVWEFRNDGRRTVEVTGVIAEREDMQGLVKPRRTLPATVGITDTLPVMITGTMAGRTAIFIEWRWEGDTEIRRTRRAVS